MFGPGALVSAAFARAKAARRAAFVPFFVAGDPDETTSAQLIAAAAQSGADLIELGIPFSDPIADGPIIAAGARRALRAGMTFRRALALGRSVRKRLGALPLLAFAYYNVVLQQGIENAAATLAANGFSGMLVPDVPFEEAGELIDACDRFGLAFPLLVAPTTPPARAARIAGTATGFVYVVSRMGVTGTHAPGGDVFERVEALRAASELPVAVGFGIAGTQDAARIAAAADGVIVGSALVERAATHPPPEAVCRVRALCAQLSAACKRGASDAAAERLQEICLSEREERS
jgi:tryptophan synthase alpha chain